jgi:hypothetical protein
MSLRSKRSSRKSLNPHHLSSSSLVKSKKLLLMNNSSSYLNEVCKLNEAKIKTVLMGNMSEFRNPVSFLLEAKRKVGCAQLGGSGGKGVGHP